MRYQNIFLFLLLLIMIIATPLFSNNLLSDIKGENLVFYTCDLNGDSLIDTIVLKKVEGLREIMKKKYEMLDFSKLSGEVGEEIYYLDSSQRVILIYLSNTLAKNYKKYCFCERDYLSGSMWETDFLPITIGNWNRAKKVLYQYCEIQPPGDVMVLSTEASIDIYIYWNGSDFKLCEPPLEEH